MLTMSNPDLNGLFFEHKLIPRIEGGPNFNTIHQLLRLLKANAYSVPCTLGGGANTYIGMLVPDITYGTLAPDTPFVAPVHPGTLLLSPGLTQCQIVLWKSQYKGSLRVFREHQLM